MKFHAALDIILAKMWGGLNYKILKYDFEIIFDPKGPPSRPTVWVDLTPSNLRHPRDVRL